MSALRLLRVLIHLFRGLATCALVFPLIDEAGRRARIKMWAAETRELLAETAIEAGVEALRFHPDGSRLLVLGEDGAVRSWNFASQDEVSRTGVRERGPR